MRESEIEKYFTERVIAADGEVRKVQWIGRAHAPDRVAMFKHRSPGKRTWWVELKAPKKGPRPGQAREHDRMRAVGQNVVVLNSIEAVDKWCEEVGI